MNEIFQSVTIGHFLVLSAMLFCLGIVGVLMRRNSLIVMMSVELMLNAANLTLVSFSRFHNDPVGQGFALVVIAVAAAEAAVGLAIVVTVFRTRRHVDIDRLTLLRN